MPTAVTGPNKITKIGTDTVPPPKPEYPWIVPLVNNINADISSSVGVTTEKKTTKRFKNNSGIF